MDCVSPPCTGTVRDDVCPSCGLKQTRTTSGIKVDGPLHVTRRSKDGTEQPMMGRSVTVGLQMVTVYLRVNDKATRSFELDRLVSIQAA